MEEYKTCTDCGQIKSLQNFSASAKGKNGLRSNCKPCNAARTRAYRLRNPNYASTYSKAYRAANPEKVKFNNAKFREQNPDYGRNYYQQHKELERLRGKIAYWKDPVKQSKRKRLARQTNPDAFRERNRAYAINNRQKLNEKAARRRAAKSQSKSFVITEKELVSLYNSRCAYCDSPATTLDHVIPLSRTGNHGIGNLVPACGPCNFSKKDRTIMEWRIWKLRLGL